MRPNKLRSAKGSDTSDQLDGHQKEIESEKAQHVVETVGPTLHLLQTSFSGGGRVKKPTDFERGNSRKQIVYSISQDSMHELSDITTERFR